MILQNLHKSVFAQISEDRQFSIPRFFSQLRALQVNWSLKKSFFSQWSHLKRTTRMAKANCIVNLAQPPPPLGLPAICQTCSLIWTRVLWGSQLGSITPSQRLTNISLTDFPLNRPLFLQISLFLTNVSLDWFSAGDRLASIRSSPDNRSQSPPN